MLNTQIISELRSIQTRLTENGTLPTLDKLNQYYATFHDHFGPDKLQQLDGEELLITMHGMMRTNRNTMVYWLEFKDDEEFPAIFGSIAGGSALKYGVYPDGQSGEWMGRGQGNKPIKIPLAEAIAIARKHRMQLLRSVELLQQLSAAASDAEYAQLQRALDEQAPDVSQSAWGHKYFSLLFPDKLDDFHVANYQRFHLVRLLQNNLPNAKAGRYITAGRYVAIARQLEMPINHLTTILNHRTRRPYSYWRLVLDHPQLNQLAQWQAMQEDGAISLAWDALGDLAYLTYTQESKDALRSLMKQQNESDGRLVVSLLHFVTLAQPDDLVLATAGDNVLGVGRIVGPYQYQAGGTCKHRRRVEWLSTERWGLPVAEGKNGNWYSLGDYANQVEAEKQILGRAAEIRPNQTSRTAAQPVQLSCKTAQLQAILQRKGQVILYGPPGTGKTYVALQAARDLAALKAFERPFAQLNEQEQSELQQTPGGLIQLVTFHPGYGYEDFIEGYRPQGVDGTMRFVLRDGIFKQMANEAARHPERDYFLLIDEINRGDIPRIFGELLTLLEKDKRNQRLTLPISGEHFVVPTNVYVIGTMNTADRSVALLDTALRRRFGFIELMPDYSLFEQTVIEGIPVGLWLQALNRRIVELIGRDARNLQIGHAYLLEAGKPIEGFSRFARVLQEDIIPLLEEYSYEDYATLEKILGRSLVDIGAQRVRHELFTEGRDLDLIQALLEPTPDLTTTAQVVKADEEEQSDVEENGQL